MVLLLQALNISVKTNCSFNKNISHLAARSSGLFQQHIILHTAAALRNNSGLLLHMLELLEVGASLHCLWISVVDDYSSRLIMTCFNRA